MTDIDSNNINDNLLEGDDLSEDRCSGVFVSDMIPIRGMVAFPDNLVPLTIGRPCSICVIDNSLQENEDKTVILLTQKDDSMDFPDADFDNFYNVGVAVNINHENTVRLPQSILKITVDVKYRVKIHKIMISSVSLEDDTKVYRVLCSKVEDKEDDQDQRYKKILAKTLLGKLKEYIEKNDKLSKDLYTHFLNVKDKKKLPDMIAPHLLLEFIKIEERQSLLECFDLCERAERICTLIQDSTDIINTEVKIKAQVKDQMDKTHTRYYLLEQLKAIQKELGEHDSTMGGEINEISDLEKKIESLKLTDAAREKVLDEVKKLKMMSPISAEATVSRAYIDWLISLPWGEVLESDVSLKKAKDILDINHYGMEEVKDRVLEYLAVQKRVGKVSGSVLCLLGPPGVGKTSLVKSIAESMGRPFVKISLGGVKDESEIRGHRRTYIGSMPGKILQAMKKARYTNPLILLDEIDKMGSDFRGDPASALLEVLDSEQNKQFADHYLEVEYDLSNVVFVATSNTMEIPYALLDRLEIIRVSGYTEEEKIHISQNYLLKRVRKDHGFTGSNFKISGKALLEVIRFYTRESGVRGLKRELEKLARKSVHDILLNKIKNPSITVNNLSKYLGVRKYLFGEISEEDIVGVVTGLAYTEVGGELLKIESVLLPGKGTVRSTGKLGEVMQESVQAAYSFIISRCWKYGIRPSYYGKHDVHVHVPAGATPKDGPSAGIAMTTAMVSVMTGIPVKKDIAMTGEVTLSGRVLPIGGLKEKLLAALRGGVTRVLIPKKNGKDLIDMPANVKEKLDIILVDNVDEVLKKSLQKMPKSIIAGSKGDESSEDDDMGDLPTTTTAHIKDDDFTGITSDKVS